MELLPPELELRVEVLPLLPLLLLWVRVLPDEPLELREELPL